MLLVFEGLDGTGKTSLSNELVRRLGGVYLKTPPQEYEYSRRTIHNTNNPYTRFFYYLSSNVFLSESIDRIPADSILVCDRYFYTSLADFAYYSKVDYGELLFWIKLLEKICHPPDIVFFCYCDRQIRLERIHERNASQVDDILSVEFEQAMLDNFHKILPQHSTISLDTTKMKVDELCDAILKQGGLLSSLMENINVNFKTNKKIKADNEL